MQTLHFSIFIEAPKEKVWNTMLEDATYREWTKHFSPGSYYQGDWSEGSKMLFLGPNPETGEEGGMVSRVKENRPYEYISLEHYGEIHNGVEKPWGEGLVSYENYTFVEKEEGTEVFVEMTNVPDEYNEMADMWPTALEALKVLSEKEK
jgi:hypothetical protein